MISTPVAVNVPLRTDAVIRIGASRVTLHTLISLYRSGETPEALHEGFPTVSLADIYATIAYYLANQEVVDAYLRQIDEDAERFRCEYEAKHPPQITREILLARLEKKHNRENE